MKSTITLTYHKRPDFLDEMTALSGTLVTDRAVIALCQHQLQINTPTDQVVQQGHEDRYLSDLAEGLKHVRGPANYMGEIERLLGVELELKRKLTGWYWVAR